MEDQDKSLEEQLEQVDLEDSRAIADFYLARNNIIDPDELSVEKKEKELREDIESIVDDKEALIDYLTNLHASIEVMEERIYELELKIEKKEKETPVRPPNPSLPRGLSNIPFGIL